MAALILTVTVYSFASWLALDGVPDSESGLFVAMAAVVGLHQEGVSVASGGWLLVARLADLGVLASAVAIGLTRRHQRRAARETP